MFLDYFALFLLVFVAVVIFYGVIAIHDIPYEIARHRNHPQQDALHVAGWISLFTLHILWPFLWIWATLYREDRGWGFQAKTDPNTSTRPSLLATDEHQMLVAELSDLATRLTVIEKQVTALTESPDSVQVPSAGKAHPKSEA